MSRRFFVDPAMIRREGEAFFAELEGEEAHHAVRVLRLGPGDDVVLLDDSGQEYYGRIESVAMQGKAPRVTVRGFSMGIETSEPRTALTLVQALPKGDKMDEIVQKGTETGVSHFVPVISERVVVEYGGAKEERRLERWRRIAHEAAKQARRGRRPQVAPITPLVDALRRCASEGPVLVLWENASLPMKPALKQIAAGVVRGAFQQALRIALVVGPEGGFSEGEAVQLERLGGRLVSLGPRILRTETAGPVAAAIVLYELEMQEAPPAPELT